MTFAQKKEIEAMIDQMIEHESEKKKKEEHLKNRELAEK